MADRRKLCPKCQLGALIRVGREGFLDAKLSEWFGLYPWICTECKSRVRIKSKGIKKRR